jgi:hypothetical protein
MKKLSDRVKDKVVFVAMCIVLIALFLGWKSCGLPSGNGGGGMSQQGMPLLPDSAKSLPKSPEAEQENTGETKETVVKLYLGRRGVSADQITWYDADQFASYIKQLKEKHVREVHYTLLPDSIERLEKRWDAELKKANMKNYIEAD